MDQIMKKSILLTTLLLAGLNQVFAFCGFYVAKADASLFNNKSQVILVRDGNRTILTMSNDFKGNVNDFAMVVPVPVVLQRDDIKVINASIFQKLDNYSAPRLVEYFDSNPCGMIMADEMMDMRSVKAASSISRSVSGNNMKSYGVKIEAQYSVGEYDILILSAEQSGGLKTWLNKNGYKIPGTANEVLDPYIRSNMKFFVVKVNLENHTTKGYNNLRPLQISFNSDRFMLPLRLGMANANGAQDLLIYAFTRSGRIEAVNYRTIKMPTDRKIPLFIKEKFTSFYRDLFEKAYQRENRKAVFLEYAWNVSPLNNIKCDPCVAQPPYISEFREAGVSWTNDRNSNNHTFFTRLHVRYTRDRFPQDLFFQVTPNTENFQARYVLTHPAKGQLDCKEGTQYLNDLADRRAIELQEMEILSGWDANKYQYYTNVGNRSDGTDDFDENSIIPVIPGDQNKSDKWFTKYVKPVFQNGFSLWIACSVMLFLFLVVWLVRNSNTMYTPQKI
jgi:hypothetical protein